ncbi:transcriptional regulator [Mycobacterium malmoense]|nr:RNA-binding domain-containing protein [Mycobacterium malmoense]OCB51219.1 transcriptional regulator [Mycobacterium malmoense]
MTIDVLRLVKSISNGAVPRNLESYVLDFKQEKATFKETAADLAEACVCFANASGGTLILGIRDNPGGPDAIVGTEVSRADLRSKIHELTQPSLTVSISEHWYDTVRLLEITVPEGLEVYATTKGEYRQRWRDECRPMSPAEVGRLSEERKGDDWSGAASDSSTGDVHPVAIERLRELLRATGDDTKIRLSQAPTTDVLARLGLLSDKGQLTRAGEILLVDQGRSGPPELLVYQHRKSRGGEADYSRRWNGPLITCFAEALEIIGARTTVTPVTLRSGQQIQIEDFPSSAVREALANALIHRDLVDNQPVLVEHSPSALTIRSPGPLVSGVTPENILTRGTKPRYPLLARAFNNLGWSEYLGQGVNRMFREMARTGRPLPVITSEPERVEVVFSGERPNAHVARVTAELPENLADDTDTLIVLMTLCTRRSVTAAQISPLIQRSIESAEETLRTACKPDVELLEPTAGTRNRRHPHYRFRGDVLARLGSAVTYHSRTSSEVDKKIIDHVREYDSINNAAIQRLFDVDVYSARDILQDLVGREILTRTSTQKRGKAVRYGKGPKFPDKKVSGRRRSPKNEQLELL